MPTTPVWNLPYPCAGETIDPSIFCDFSDAVDAALVTINANAEFVANRPNVRLDRTGSVNTFAAGVGVNVQYNSVNFDNDGMANLGADPAVLTVQTPGVYWATFSLGGFSTFTTWTRYLMLVSVNGGNWIFRKYMVNTAQGTPADNTIQGALVCQAGDQIRTIFQFIGTGGPMVATRGSFCLSFICDL
jgi:hypothetical protein